MRYLLGRLSHALFLLAGVSILAFLFTALAPGNYFDEMRLSPQIGAETIAALRAQYGFDKPLPVRYVSWLTSVIHGEMGFSFAYNSPVAPLLLVRARNTLLLPITATLLSWGTAALLVIPDLALALGLLVFAVRSGWFPTGGMASVDFETLSPLNKLRDLALHMILPVTALVLSSLPLLLRHVRAAVADVLNAPFLLAAVGHGIPRRTLLYRYALPAAANPLIALFGFSIGVLLSGSLLVEAVMSWPGLGPLLLEAILTRDLYVVVGGILFSTLFLVGGNLLADFLLYWADPRIRTESSAR